MKVLPQQAKKAELDALTKQVLDAQYDVAQFQSAVDSLTEKVANFQGFLTVAGATLAQADTNRQVIDQLVQSATNLKNNSDIAFNEMVLADAKIKALAAKIKIVIDQLIYSSEAINKLSNFVIHKKALNPLISDELVAMLATAGNDANNAVALTLVALQSVFASQVSTTESKAALALEYTQSIDLLQGLTQDVVVQKGKKTGSVYSLRQLLDQAYNQAKTNDTHIGKALNSINVQLNHAQAELAAAEVKLRSLQSALAAASAT